MCIRDRDYTRIVLDQQQYDSRTIPFKRGDIVDRNGTKMATSERVYNVILDVKVMTSDEDLSLIHIYNYVMIKNVVFKTTYNRSGRHAVNCE